MKIKDVKARQILDSRGNPTVEAEVIVEAQNSKVKSQSYGVSDGFITGIASVPSGASTGEHEAVELRDGEMVHFWGKGVQKAVDNVEQVIGPALKGMEVMEQRKIDEKMIGLDGTENKSKLGANAILAVSMACVRAASEVKEMELFEYLSRFQLWKPEGDSIPASGRIQNDSYVLPIPFINVINGGKHAPDGVDFQEFMIVPHGFSSFTEALESADEVFMKLKEILHQDGYKTLVGDEGGFAPAFKKNEQALDYLMRAIEKAGFKAGEEMSLAVDAAASELYVGNPPSRKASEDTVDAAASELYEQNGQDGRYELKTENLKLTTNNLIEYWGDLVGRYPIVSLEDALDEEDWEGWNKLSEKLIVKSEKVRNSLQNGGQAEYRIQNSGKNHSKLETRNLKLQLVGDDLLVTNPKRLQRAIKEKTCNAILIKLNQIGTVTETIDVINLAHENGFKCMVSHRSGETEDTFIADLAVGTGTGQIKAGSLSRSERVAKYNRLLKIEEELGERTKFGKLEI